MSCRTRQSSTVQTCAHLRSWCWCASWRMSQLSPATLHGLPPMMASSCTQWRRPNCTRHALPLLGHGALALSSQSTIAPIRTEHCGQHQHRQIVSYLKCTLCGACHVFLLAMTGATSSKLYESHVVSCQSSWHLCRRIGLDCVAWTRQGRLSSLIAPGHICNSHWSGSPNT